MKEIGYSDSFKLPEWIRNALIKFENENGVHITVVNKAGQPQLRKDATLSGLVIYDFSCPGTPTQSEIREISYFTYVRKQDGRCGIFYPKESTDGVFYLKSVGSLGEEYSTDGTRWPACTFSDGVVWTHLYLANFGLKKDGGEAFDRTVIDSLRKAIDTDHWDAVRKNLEASTEKKFGEFISKRLSENVKDLEEDLMNIKGQNEFTIKHLVMQNKKIIEKSRELEYYQKLSGQEAAYYINQLQTLRKSSRITNVVFRGQTLEVLTDKLYLYSPNRQTRAYLGKFKISMTDLEDLSIENIDNSRGGRSHPHVEGTRPCLGQAQVTMSQLLAKGEIVALFNYIFQYLETFNPKDDYGKYFTYWFGNDEDNPTIEKRLSDGKFHPKFPNKIEDTAVSTDITNEDELNDETTFDGGYRRGEIVE